MTTNIISTGKRNWLFVVFGLFTAYAVDFLFWGIPAGISFPIWIFLLIAGGFILAWREGVRPAPLSIVVALVTLGVSTLPFFRAEGLTRFVNTGLALLGLFLLSTTFSSGNWLRYRLFHYIEALFYLLVAAFSRPAEILFSKNKTAGERDGEEGNDLVKDEEEGETGLHIILRGMAPVLRGLLIALPVVLILGALLASADLVFQQWLTDLLSFIDLERIPEYLFRLFYIVVILGYTFTGIYLHTIQPKKEVSLPKEEKVLLKPFLGWVESTIVLVSVNLLFLVFVFIQFRYLFGGEANISLADYTYAEYARRGFGELVAVAILSLGLHLVLGAIVKRKTKAHRTGFSILAVILNVLVLVLLASAMQRLYMYENVYGFSRMRTYPHVFIIWLGVLLLANIILEVLRKRRAFALALLLFGAGFCITLGVLNVDGFIARQNVLRVADGYMLDGDYLKQLSSDAVPEMVSLYHQNDMPRAARDVLGAELACRTVLIEEEMADRKWQSFHYAEQKAYGWLQAYKGTWSDYEVYQNGSYVWWVKGNDIDQSCEYDLWDDF